MKRWLVTRPGGGVVGPVTTELLRAGITAGKVPLDVRVCLEGDAAWFTIDRIAELADLASTRKPPPTMPILSEAADDDARTQVYGALRGPESTERPTDPPPAALRAQAHTLKLGTASIPPIPLRTQSDKPQPIRPPIRLPSAAATSRAPLVPRPPTPRASPEVARSSSGSGSDRPPHEPPQQEGPVDLLDFDEEGHSTSGQRRHAPVPTTGSPASQRMSFPAHEPPRASVRPPEGVDSVKARVSLSPAYSQDENTAPALRQLQHRQEILQWAVIGLSVLVLLALVIIVALIALR